MRTIEFSAGESRDENVPAGTVPNLTLLILVRTSEAGFLFRHVTSVPVVYFSRESISLLRDYSCTELCK